MKIYSALIVTFLNYFIIVLIFTTTLVSCSKDDAPSIYDPTITGNNAEKMAAISLYNTYYSPSKTSSNAPTWNGNITTCTAGITAQETRNKILMRIHYFRKASGLNNVLTENTSKSSLAMEAALIMHANNKLSHTPSNDWKCFSEDGKTGAGASLLATVNNAEAIDLYIKDPGSNNGAVGHRRWLCYSKLQEIGIGNTSSFNAIYVLGSSGATPEDAPEFLSWPPKGYIPIQFAYDRWSFSLPNATFDDAQVSLKNNLGMNIPLNILPIEKNHGDNTLVWEPSGISKDIMEDTSYTVTVSNVRIGMETKSFTYTVTFFNINS